MISQVIGLAKEFSLNITSIEAKLFFPWSRLQPGILPIFSWIFKNDLDSLSRPDFIISCGRKSVYVSIYLKKKYKNIRNIHIQNPKINFKYFDYIIAPKHDNISGKNVISSIGAIHKFKDRKFNEVINQDFKIPTNNLISIIVGGNNNHYKFTLKEANDLIMKIKNIKIINSNFNLLTIFSRRTSQEVKDKLSYELKKISLISDQFSKNTYSFALKNSIFFVVTSDSTSMVSECAFTKKPIYVYHLPFKRKSERIIRFHDLFEKLEITKKFNHTNNFISWTYDSLNESKRIAGIIKERIIKEI